jgi:N-acetylglutamate synthase-like GNAT family acetyltransferase
LKIGGRAAVDHDLHHRNIGGRVPIREAQKKDLNPIRELLQSLKLPVDGVEEHLNHFSVLIEDDSIVGTVGLEVYSPKALLRSLGVRKDYQGLGHGRLLYEAAMKEALLKKNRRGVFTRKFK